MQSILHTISVLITYYNYEKPELIFEKQVNDFANQILLRTLFNYPTK